MTPEQDRIAYRNEGYAKELVRYWVQDLKVLPIEEVIDMEDICPTETE